MSTHEAVRSALQQRLEKLTQRVGKIEADLRRPQDPDWQERAVERENDEVLERLDTSSLDEVRQLQRALARIDDGTYGTCERCGSLIGEARLAAVPHASTCITCAS